MNFHCTWFVHFNFNGLIYSVYENQYRSLSFMLIFWTVNLFGMTNMNSNSVGHWASLTSFRKESIMCGWVWNRMSLGFCWFSRAAKTKPHRPDRWNNIFIILQFGGKKSKIMVLAGLVSSEASLLGLQMAVFSLCLLKVFSLCVSPLLIRISVILDLCDFV